MADQRLIRDLLFNSSAAGVPPAFDRPVDLAKALASKRGSTLAACKTDVSKLLRSGTFAQSLQALIEAAFRESLKGKGVSADNVSLLLRALHDAFLAVGVDRTKHRLGASINEAALAEAYAAAETSSCNMLLLPAIPLEPDTPEVRKIRYELALRADIGNPGAREILKVWLFATHWDCYSWFYHLVWESVAQKMTGGKKKDGKRELELARKLIGDIRALERRGLIETKVIQPSSCLLNAMLVNFRGAAELRGFCWNWDDRGQTRNMHAIAGAYVRYWSAFVDDILSNSPRVVATSGLSIELFEDDILNRRRTPSASSPFP